MKRFERGVRYYTHLTLPPQQVDFPEDDVVCSHCRYCVRDPFNGRREMCFITGELLAASEYERPGGCPLVQEEGVPDE